MRITVREQNLIQDVILSLLVLTMGGTSVYLWLARNSPKSACALAIGAAVVMLLALLFAKSHPLILIDDSGVFDRRLGVGKISWSDIEGVQIAGGYGNRLLTLRLREPDRYVKRMRGASRRRALERHELGFLSLNLDLRDVNLNLLDLKMFIEERIPG